MKTSKAIQKLVMLNVFLFFSVCCMAQKSIPNAKELCSKLTKMIENDQLHRSKMPSGFSDHKSSFSKTQIDSMNQLQRKIDNFNTEKLIDLTQTYGWISDDRMDCKELNVWLIFRHSQPQYFKDISVLIEKEHKANRLNTFQYQLIRDHILGRPRG
ncbi:MAG: hypothetical protein WA775_06800 [Psychroserpens sp.]|uniref:hypothetical protein n=1 Tax=Psychroserpens sp. TaxID=2020870 RepID=UPI003CB88386